MTLDRDTLTQLYTLQQLSDRAIGELLDVPAHQVYLTRRALGIPSRPRGHNLTGGQRPAIDYGTWRGKSRDAATRAKISAAAQQQVSRPSGQFHPMFGRTGCANPNYKHGRSPERQRVYSSYAWRVVIEYVYGRDGGECQRCGGAIEHQHKNQHHHHLAGWEDFPERRIDPENVVLMCRPCHEWIHSAQNTARHFLIGVQES